MQNTRTLTLFASQMLRDSFCGDKCKRGRKKIHQQVQQTTITQYVYHIYTHIHPCTYIHTYKLLLGIFSGTKWVQEMATTKQGTPRPVSQSSLQQPWQKGTRVMPHPTEKKIIKKCLSTQHTATIPGVSPLATFVHCHFLAYICNPNLLAKYV